MKYIIISITFMLAMLSSCSYVSKIADAAIGTQMDNESTYTKAAEMLGEVDPAWKVYYLRIANEGVSEKCQNTLGYISVGMMNADGDVYYQNLYPVKTDPTIDKFAPDGATFDGIPAIDFNVEKAMKNINECKSMIPEGYKFLNLELYSMKYEVNAKGFVTEIIINIQEIGKESVDVNGTQSGIYYQLTYTITPDGTIKVKES